MTQKPTVHQVYGVLREENALVVHFSTTGKGREYGQIVGDLEGAEREVAIKPHLGQFYPGDLQYAIGNTGQTLCCSTIKPTDHAHANAMGSVGLVLGLQAPHSLRTVASSDDGYLGPDDNRDMDVTLDLCRETIKKRPGGHNEWLVQGYHVLGVLCLRPLEAFSALLGGPVELKLPDVQKEFSNLPLYGAANGAWYLMNADGSGTKVPHSTIYS